MSLYRHSGPFLKTPLGYIGAVYKQLKKVDLRPVQRVVFSFDPFHPDVRDFRNLMFHLSSPKIRATNNKCVYKVDVVSDLSDPNLLFKLENGTQLIFKSSNLTTLEILDQLNRILGPLLPPESTETPIAQTKSQRKR